MGGQIAGATDNGRAPLNLGPPPKGNSANVDSTSFELRIKDAQGFATGMQSLLVEIGRQDADTSAPSILGNKLNQDAPVTNLPQNLGSARSAESRFAVEVSVSGFTSEPVQGKFSPQAQQKSVKALPAIKESRYAHMAGHFRSAKGAQLTCQSIAPHATPNAMADFPTATPVEALAVAAPKLTPKSEVTSGILWSPNSAIGNAADHDPVTQETLPVSVTDPGELTNLQHALIPQEGEPAAPIHSEPTVNPAQAPISPSTWTEQVAPSAEAALTLSGSLPGQESKATVADPLVSANAALNPSSSQNHSRRIDAAPALEPSRSTTRSTATAAKNEANPDLLHASMQGATAIVISNSMPVRDGTVLDRHSIPPPSSAANSSSGVSGEQDAFAALDRATSGPETAWIHAGAHRAEAGYLDSSFGWVTVRADGTTGGVHASVVPNSAEAASALSNHLAGLNAFMADHQGHSTTVTLASPANEGSRPGSSQQDGSMNGYQNHQQQPDSNSSTSVKRNSNSSSVSLDSENASNPIAVLPATARNGRGVHLSVMA